MKILIDFACIEWYTLVFHVFRRLLMWINLAQHTAWNEIYSVMNNFPSNLQFLSKSTNLKYLLIFLFTLANHMVQYINVYGFYYSTVVLRVYPMCKSFGIRFNHIAVINDFNCGLKWLPVYSKHFYCERMNLYSINRFIESRLLNLICHLIMWIHLVLFFNCAVCI